MVGCHIFYVVNFVYIAMSIIMLSRITLTSYVAHFLVSVGPSKCQSSHTVHEQLLSKIKHSIHFQTFPFVIKSHFWNLRRNSSSSPRCRRISCGHQDARVKSKKKFQLNLFTLTAPLQKKSTQTVDIWSATCVTWFMTVLRTGWVRGAALKRKDPFCRQEGVLRVLPHIKVH